MAGNTPGPGAGDGGADGREDPPGPDPDAAPRAWLHPSELGPRIDRTPEPPAPIPHRPIRSAAPGRALVVLATASVAAVATLGVALAVRATDPAAPGRPVTAPATAPRWPVVAVRAADAGGARVATGLCVRGGVLTAAEVVDGAAVVTVATGRDAARAQVTATDPDSGLAYLTGARCPEGAARLVADRRPHDGEPVVLLTAARTDRARHRSWARLAATGGAVSGVAEARTGTAVVRADPLAAPAGAPVLDRRGDLVALVIAARGGRLLAVPAALVERVVAQFAAGEPVRAGWLGVELDLAGRIVDVRSDSPAARAGLQPGETVYALDGRRTASVDLVLGALQAHAPGDRITLTLERDGRTREVSARLATNLTG